MLSISGAIFQTLIYADLFDYPLTLSEIDKFLIWQDAKRETQYAGKDSLKSMEKKLVRDPFCVLHIAYHEGFYFLKDREKSVVSRKSRKKWSQKKINIANRTAVWLKMIPWIKMVAITGSLAMNNVDKNDDIDFMIVTSKNRLWLTRFFTVLLMELMGKRRKPAGKNFENKICLNMFLDEGHLKVPKKEQDLFTAHEVCQMKLLWNRNETYKRFLKENQWVKKFLPNAIGKVESNKHEAQSKKSENYLIFALIFLFFENLAGNFQIRYMKSRRTTEIIQPGRILFHPRDARKWILVEYEKKLNSLGIKDLK